MPQKHKTILTEGKYWIPSLNRGKGGYKDIDAKYLHKIASTVQNQQRAGHKIPAPWKHDDKATPIVMGNKDSGSLKTSYDNGGFWEAIFVTERDGKTVLEGIIDAPGSDADVNSPYAKLGTTVKDTSIYISEKWKDGKGVEWDEPVMHVALCTHPIEPGQDTFKPVNGGVAIAMSMESVSVPVPNILATLREQVGINLPDDTTEDNFIERLYVALLQVNSSDSARGTTRTPPKGAREETPSMIVMSFDAKQLEALAKSTNPLTGKQYTSEEIKDLTGQEVKMSSPPEKVDPPKDTSDKPTETEKLLMSLYQGSERRQREDRIRGMIEQGRITEDYAKDKLKPLVESFQMSFDDSYNPLPNQLDMVLDAIEASAPKAQPKPQDNFLNQLAMSAPPQGSQVVGLPEGSDPNASPWKDEDELNKALDSIFK